MEGATKKIRTLCPDCLVVGIQTQFFSLLELQRHESYHESGLVQYQCSICKESVANNKKSREEHEELHIKRSATSRLQNRDLQDEQRSQRCPICSLVLDKVSEARFFRHVHDCKGNVSQHDVVDGRDAVQGDELGQQNLLDQELVYVDNNGAHDMFDQQQTQDESSFNDFGPEPVWNDEKFFSHALHSDPHEFFPADSLLLNTLRAKGHLDLSDAALDCIWKVLNCSEFRTAYNNNGLSASFDIVLRREKEIYNKMFQQVSHNKSVVFVRDLKDVFQEMMSDKALVESMLHALIENKKNHEICGFEVAYFLIFHLQIRASWTGCFLIFHTKKWLFLLVHCGSLGGFLCSRFFSQTLSHLLCCFQILKLRNNFFACFFSLLRPAF
jgi:hypothetical protein